MIHRAFAGEIDRWPMYHSWYSVHYAANTRALFARLSVLHVVSF